MARKLSVNVLQVLASLPKEPVCVEVGELAEDVFGRKDPPARSAVKAALNQLSGLTYIEVVNTRPYGCKDRYGIRADLWDQAQAVFDGVDVGELLACQPIA